MADQSHLDVLKEGVEAWNAWRRRNPSMHPDLSGANLRGASLFMAYLSETDLSGADLSKANLERANLRGANLRGARLNGASLIEANLRGANLRGAKLNGANLERANLRGANLTEVYFSKAHLTEAHLTEANLTEANLTDAMLSRANLERANLTRANLRGANLFKAKLTEANFSEAKFIGAYLRGAKLTEANLFKADLSEANLRGANLFKAKLTEANLTDTDLSEANLTEANLQYCILVRANLQGSMLTNCRIYGISAWDLMLSKQTEQSNLVISPGEGNTFATVDDLEVAQFIYLLFDNRKLRNIIQTMSSTAVLILGNFAPERMEILQAIRERLRDNGYLPILFDFEGPENRNLIDTVTTVARLVRFVIADLTQPRSVPAELGAIVPTIESLPVQPMIEEPEEPYGMFSDLVVRHSILKVHHYKDLGHLLESFDDEIIAPAEDKFAELKEARVRAIKEKL